jgi:hypothetical protein
MKTLLAALPSSVGQILRRAGMVAQTMVVLMHELKISYQYPRSRPIILFTQRDHPGYEHKNREFSIVFFNFLHKF